MCVVASSLSLRAEDQDQDETPSSSRKRRCHPQLEPHHGRRKRIPAGVNTIHENRHDEYNHCHYQQHQYHQQHRVILLLLTFCYTCTLVVRHTTIGHYAHSLQLGCGYPSAYCCCCCSRSLVKSADCCCGISVDTTTCLLHLLLSAVCLWCVVASDKVHVEAARVARNNSTVLGFAAVTTTKPVKIGNRRKPGRSSKRRQHRHLPHHPSFEPKEPQSLSAAPAEEVINFGQHVAAIMPVPVDNPSVALVGAEAVTSPPPTTTSTASTTVLDANIKKVQLDNAEDIEAAATGTKAITKLESSSSSTSSSSSSTSSSSCPVAVFDVNEDPDGTRERVKFLDDDASALLPFQDSYVITWGECIPRTGKIFSYTFWRTQLYKNVFWSMQGNDWENTGNTVISTQYLGAPEQARRFVQEVILTHPSEPQIRLTYTTTCQDGLNTIQISRRVINHFRLDNNSFRFEFRIVRLRKKPYAKTKNSSPPPSTSSPTSEMAHA